MILQDSTLLKSLCLIDGQWVPADSGAAIAVRNPATGALVASVPNADAVETRRTIAAADRAFAAWRDRTAEDRARSLRRRYELMLQHQHGMGVSLKALGQSVIRPQERDAPRSTDPQ